MVLGDLFPHQEDVVVTPHLFRHSVAQGLADGGRHHLCPFRDFGFLYDLDSHRSRWGGLGCRRRRIGAVCLRGSGDRVRVFAFFDKYGDGRIDLHALGAFGDQDLADDAFIDGLELHGRLVGLDLGHDVAGRDGIAFLHEPFGQRTFSSIVGERAGIRTSVAIYATSPASA